MQSNTPKSEKILIAIVGMPGSGKSETAAYLKEKGFSIVRFGDATEEGLREQGLDQTPDNEEKYREDLRKRLGMAAYAIKAEPKIDILLKGDSPIVLDGLYSWEEYLYLKSRFPTIILVHLFARPEVRYGRLSSRSERPFTKKEAYARDIAEIERLNKAGPIAIADHIIINESDKEALHMAIDSLWNKLGKENNEY